MSLVFRAYHALTQSNFRSPDGMPTGAIYGFLNIITNFLEKENPEYIAIAFDTSAPTFRHEKYDFYKANRSEFPVELEPQLPIIKLILDLIGIPRIELPGFEADDIIGTIAKMNANSENHFYLLTSDKDFYQLIDENISVMKPAGFKTDDFEIISYSGVFEKFGVSPYQVIEVLALTGDAIDNIPGVKGIGEKTAIPLIQKWGTIDKLYENIESIDKTSIKSKLIEGKENAFISRELATIETNMDLDINLTNLKRQQVNYIELDKLLKKLGFTKIRQRWANKRIDSDDHLNNIDYPKVSNITNENYTLINVNNYNEINYDDILNKLINISHIYYYIDISAHKINKIYLLLDNNILKIQFSDTSNNNYNDLDLFSSSLDNQFSLNKEFYTLIERIFHSNQITKISYDIKHQLKILNKYNIDIKLPFFDIMLASYISNPDNNHNLLGIIKKYETEISEILESANLNFDDDYYKYLLIAIKKIYYKLQTEIESQEQNLLAYKIEFPLVDVLKEMELNGVKVDKKSLQEISIELEKQITNLKSTIYQYAGEEFNIESPKQLAVILFDKLKLPTIKKTKTGASTDISVLMELLDQHPVIEKLIEFRQIVKLKNAYVDALPKLINPSTGKIHTTYQQTIAATGRLSSIEPNLQNIPIRTEQGREIRKAFVSSFDNGKIMSADYSQIELRIMAYYSQDDTLIEAFKNNIDIHSATASKLFSINISNVDSNYRRIAKTVNFGIMYGLGSFGLAQRLKIPRNQAQMIIKNYFEKYPGIKNYIDSTIRKTEEQGYIETLMKRRRYFPDIRSNNRNVKSAAERAAINFPIQGTAADMIKLAMIQISNDFRINNYKSKLILQVHDEIVVDLYPDEEIEVKEVLINRMQNAMKLDEVPVIVEVGVGNNWLEAH